MSVGDIVRNVPKELIGPLLDEIRLSARGQYIAIDFSENGEQFHAIARNGRCQGFSFVTSDILFIDLPTGFTDSLSSLRSGGVRALVQWFVTNNLITGKGTIA